LRKATRVGATVGRGARLAGIVRGSGVAHQGLQRLPRLGRPRLAPAAPQRALQEAAGRAARAAWGAGTRLVRLVREGGTRRVQLVRGGGGRGRERVGRRAGGREREREREREGAGGHLSFRAAAPESVAAEHALTIASDAYSRALLLRARAREAASAPAHGRAGLPRGWGAGARRGNGSKGRPLFGAEEGNEDGHAARGVHSLAGVQWSERHFRGARDRECRFSWFSATVGRGARRGARGACELLALAQQELLMAASACSDPVQPYPVTA